jgi:hypothetical protein
MKKIALLSVAVLSLSGCLGNSSSGNDVIGQVKKAKHITPLICPDRDTVDVSLGVMRNGVGSVSKEDLELYVPNPEDFNVLQQASKTGSLVKVTYSEARFFWCAETTYVTHAEIAP